MQTNIIEQFLKTPKGQEANTILRSCVHCGFCTATCPTYQLLGDELDGPRGRIYLIKQVLEGKEVSEKTQQHLDRCLTCRSCETTCPSGVKYSRLLDIGREMVEQQVARNTITRLKRYALRKIIPYPERYAALLAVARLAQPILPQQLKQKIPGKQVSLALSINQLDKQQDTDQKTTQRTMLILDGCAQKVSTPNTNIATKRVLQHFDIQVVSAPSAGCCGAVSHHLNATQEGLEAIKRNIDAWWPYIQGEQSVEAIIITASGCGAHVKEYGHLLKHDKAYAEKAQKVSSLAKDVSEILTSLDFQSVQLKPVRKKVTFHSPCTLQHGQQLAGVVESLLAKLEVELTPVADAHLCCGSAGTYSILQPELSQRLLNNKLHHLNQTKPDLIVTANIGCQMHLQSQSQTPVKHWVELIDEMFQ